MRYIKSIAWGMALAGALTVTGCADDYLDTIPSTSISDQVVNSSLENLYIALNGIHKKWYRRKPDTSVWVVNRDS